MTHETILHYFKVSAVRFFHATCWTFNIALFLLKEENVLGDSPALLVYTYLRGCLEKMILKLICCRE